MQYMYFHKKEIFIIYFYRVDQNKLDKLLVELICDPRKIKCQEYPKYFFIGTMTQVVTHTDGYYWNIFNKQRLNLIEQLLKDGANPNQIIENNEPLIFCSVNPYKFDRFDMVELLLKYGANPNIKYNDVTIFDKIDKNKFNDFVLLLHKYDYSVIEIETTESNITCDKSIVDNSSSNYNYLCCLICFG